jgi:hypothetical protein
MKRQYYMDESIENLPKNIIKSEMKRKNVSSKEMCDLLKKESERLVETSFYNKLSRGGFSAVFFIMCMKVLKVKEIKL